MNTLNIFIKKKPDDNMQNKTKYSKAYNYDFKFTQSN